VFFSFAGMANPEWLTTMQTPPPLKDFKIPKNYVGRSIFQYYCQLALQKYAYSPPVQRKLLIRGSYFSRLLLAQEPTSAAGSIERLSFIVIAALEREKWLLKEIGSHTNLLCRSQSSRRNTDKLALSRRHFEQEVKNGRQIIRTAQEEVQQSFGVAVASNFLKQAKRFVELNQTTGNAVNSFTRVCEDTRVRVQ